MIVRYVTYLLPAFVRGALGIFLVVPLTTWYLEPTAFGQFAIVGAITAFVPAISSVGAAWVLGANTFNNQTSQQHADLIVTMTILAAVLSGAVSGALILSMDTLLAHFAKDLGESARVCFLTSLAAVALSIFWPIATSYLTLRRRATTHAVVEIGAFLANVTVVFLCLTLLPPSVLALFLGLLAGNIVSTGAMVWLLRHELFNGQFRRAHLKEIVRRGIPTNGVTLCETVQSSGLRYAMNSTVGLGPLGFFSHSESYRNIFVALAKAFAMAYGPEAIRVFSGKQSNAALVPIAKLFGAVLALGGATCTLFARDIVGLLTHGKFIEAAPLVAVWYVLAISHAYGIAHTQYLVVHKQSFFLVLSAIAPALIWLCLGIVLVNVLGIVGGAVSIMMSNISIQLWRQWRAVRLGARELPEAPYLSAAAVTLVLMPFTWIDVDLSWRLVILVFAVVLIVWLFHLNRAGMMWRSYLAALVNNR
jgi:O-antigen/teichoic acid export membrane protein